MSCDNAIKVEGLGKEYRIYQRPIDRVREMYSIRGRSYHTNFEALKDVSFSILPGETVGIIGPNGSGKSTLLEIICGTLSATSGNVQVNGRVSALLELGAGFNPSFTGRENVYLNAALMGISREEIDSKFEDILAFADIGEFVEHPVSTYSSGMYVRLAFATAINTDPDILIVDEALAVGDIRFQRKCYRKFEEMQKAGKTILFVTHAIDLVQAHCSRAIYLKSGRIRSEGIPKTVIQKYLEDLFGSTEQAVKGSDDLVLRTERVREISQAEIPRDSETIRAGSPKPKDALSPPRDLFPERPLYNPNEYRWGDNRAVFYDFSLVGQDGHQRTFFAPHERIKLAVRIFFLEQLENVIFGFTVKTVDGRVVFGANTRDRNDRVPVFNKHQKIDVCFEFTSALIVDEYFISVGVALDNKDTDNEAIDRRYDAICLPIVGPKLGFGLADLGLDISISDSFNEPNHE